MKNKLPDSVTLFELLKPCPRVLKHAGYPSMNIKKAVRLKTIGNQHAICDESNVFPRINAASHEEQD